jgi:hypothetical protein
MDLGASSFWRPIKGGASGLDLDFMLGTLPSSVTFTRATNAWYYNSAGTLTQASSDVARFDYDPVALTLKGLLIEETRTNSVSNSSMTGVVAGTPGTLCTGWAAAATAGGITRTIVGSGTVNGLPYVDLKYTGTAVAADTVLFFNTTTSAATVNATTWTSSAHLSLVGGTLTRVTVKQGLRYRAAAGASIGTQIHETTIVPTSTLTRYERTGTASDATVAFVVSSLTLTMAAGAVDVTLRIAAPQLELGAFATSNILTTAGILTRNADIAVVSTITSWYNAAEGTLFTDSVYGAALPASWFGMAASFDDGTFDNRIGLVYNPSLTRGLYVVNGGVQQSSGVDSATIVVGARTKQAGAYKANDLNFSFDGLFPPLADITSTIPTVTTLRIGASVASVAGVQHFKRLTYTPRRLTDAELQTLTT